MRKMSDNKYAVKDCAEAICDRYEPTSVKESVTMRVCTWLRYTGIMAELRNLIRMCTFTLTDDPKNPIFEFFINCVCVFF